jgi:restriction system protein
VTIVPELKRVIATSGAAGGFVLSSGSYTPDARAFAVSANIALIDSPALLERLEDVRNSTDPSEASSSPAAGAALAILTCPKCGFFMINESRGADRTPVIRSGVAARFRNVAAQWVRE